MGFARNLTLIYTVVIIESLGYFHQFVKGLERQMFSHEIYGQFVKHIYTISLEMSGELMLIIHTCHISGKIFRVPFCLEYPGDLFTSFPFDVLRERG